MSILSSFLYQFCHRSCINSGIAPLSILSTLMYRYINPVTTPVSILTALFLKATVTFKVNVYIRIHMQVFTFTWALLSWILDLNLSAAAYVRPSICDRSCCYSYRLLLGYCCCSFLCWRLWSDVKLMLMLMLPTLTLTLTLTLVLAAVAIGCY